MDMEVTAWMSLHHAMNAQDGRPFSKATLRRIGRFARPHRRQLAAFLFLSVVMAVIAVATPFSPDGSSTRSSTTPRRPQWWGSPC